jgi:2'-5' RNA ligase
VFGLTNWVCYEESDRKEGIFMRLFIALPLPQSLKETLVQWQNEQKEKGAAGRMIDEDMMHITLAFLGESHQAKKIEAILASIPFDPFDIELEGISHFKELYYAKIKESPALEQYVQTLRLALKENGIVYDAKAFKPHITLIRKARNVQDIPLKKETAITDHVILYESKTVSGKLNYIPQYIQKSST